MREHGILFSAPMVRALLAGAKTQTRRIVGDRIAVIGGVTYTRKLGSHVWESGLCAYHCPHGFVGDRLWVRETWAAGACSEGLSPRCLSGEFYNGPRSSNGGLWYRADGTEPLHPVTDRGRWRAAIHIPRWASRLTLEITNVRVQRLQDISEEDARAEGLACLTKDNGVTFKYGIADRDGWPGNDDDGWHWADWNRSARVAYQRLWDRIHGEGAWDENPWVWAISFRRAEPRGLEKYGQGVPAAAGGAAAGAAAPDATGTG